MRFIADLHIHSKYSRACSKDLTLENIDKWCALKGINIVATADFTYPAWFSELRAKLKEAGNGLYILKENSSGTFFLLGTELSCIYSKNGAVRRIHQLVFAPDLETVKKINSYLSGIGNLSADGRPILGLDVKELTKRVLDINPDCFLIPAHAWTPWFSVFGSKSGFDSLEECFGEEAKNIFAIETGLSSDPLMNWKWSALDKISLISNSDAHSLPNLGREANVFELEQPSYYLIRDAIKTRDKKKFLFTIEFFPEEGKYHFDGHASCNVSFDPETSKKNHNTCPQCGRILTIGVLNRVDNLSDRKNADETDKIPFKSLVPLKEIIAESFKKGVATKQVQDEYFSLVKKAGNEFSALIDTPIEALKIITKPEIAEAISRVREGKIKITPGYDGIYGKIEIFNKNEQIMKKQSRLI